MIALLTQECYQSSNFYRFLKAMDKVSDELLKKIQAPALDPDLARFYSLICQYPKISALWDWEKRELQSSSFASSLGSLSHGEVVLFRFFEMVWDHSNKGFDIADAAAVLEEQERKMIADWLREPFWP